MIQDNNIFEDFYILSRRDIKTFFENCLDFFQTDYILISNYYSGKEKIIASLPFKRFEELEKERDSYFETIQQLLNRMSNTKWYEIIELLEIIDSRLQTLRNINKWARASVTAVAYSPTTQIDYTLNQNQTLERVASGVLLDSDSQDSWTQIALDNQLAEEDYSSQGGNDLQLQLDRNVSLGLIVNSVVDILRGKSIYGKDLNKKLTIDPIEQDFLVLDYDETILQSVNILINLKKNDNPDYPTLGLQSAVAIGGTRSALNFPIIIRQLTQVFSSDDTLKNFKVNQIKIEQDNLLVDFTVMTRLNEIVPTKDVLL